MVKDERLFVLAFLSNHLQLLLGSGQDTGKTGSDRGILHLVAFGRHQEDDWCVAVLQDKLHVRSDAGKVLIVQSWLIMISVVVGLNQ